MRRELCVELQPEDLEKGETLENTLGLLKVSLYGTRDAAVGRTPLCSSVAVLYCGDRTRPLRGKWSAIGDVYSCVGLKGKKQNNL